MFYETYCYLPKQSLKIVESFKVCCKLSRNLAIWLFFHDFVMIQTCTYVCLSVSTLHNGGKQGIEQLCRFYVELCIFSRYSNKYCVRIRNFTWNRFPIENLLIDSLLIFIVESTFLNYWRYKNLQPKFADHNSLFWKILYLDCLPNVNKTLLWQC